MNLKNKTGIKYLGIIEGAIFAVEEVSCDHNKGWRIRKVEYLSENVAKVHFVCDEGCKTFGYKNMYVKGLIFEEGIEINDDGIVANKSW